TSIGHSLFSYPVTVALALASGLWVLVLEQLELKATWAQVMEFLSVVAGATVLPGHAPWIFLVWLFVRASRVEDGNWLVMSASWAVQIPIGLEIERVRVDFLADEVFYGIVLALLTFWMKERFATQKQLLDVNRERERLFQREHETNEMLERYNQELREANLRSSETGLWNLRGFLWKTSDLLGTCRRASSPALLTVLDVYDLRTTRSLASSLRLDLQKEMAEALHQLLPGGLIGHLGSERFGILFPDATEIPSEVNDLFHSVAGKFDVQFVIGKAVFPEDSKTAAGVLAVAEERLRIALSQRMAREEDAARRTDRLSAMGELAAGIAHEIRNPMTVVRGFIQMSSESWRDLVVNELDRINHLIGEFLSLARNTKSRRRIAEFQLTAASACSLLEPAATLAGVELIIEIPAVPLWVLHDAEQMRQVIMNLIKNALEAMDSGKVSSLGNSLPQIVVRLWSSSSLVFLSVADTGPGIPEDKIDTVFNPFYSTKESGTGLGLSIAHQLVTAHRGTMSVENRPEGGARFTISLPLADTYG
ncbi:MAG: hypothetical protein A2201_09765, partial [Alicyclobacillus sp. RIFOXYA1_FULL_53_8]